VGRAEKVSVDTCFYEVSTVPEVSGWLTWSSELFRELRKQLGFFVFLRQSAAQGEFESASIDKVERHPSLRAMFLRAQKNTLGWSVGNYQGRCNGLNALTNSLNKQIGPSFELVTTG
jgi:hypothetical protein